MINNAIHFAHRGLEFIDSPDLLHIRPSGNRFKQSGFSAVALFSRCARMIQVPFTKFLSYLINARRPIASVKLCELSGVETAASSLLLAFKATSIGNAPRSGMTSFAFKLYNYCCRPPWSALSGETNGAFYRTAINLEFPSLRLQCNRALDAIARRCVSASGLPAFAARVRRDVVLFPGFLRRAFRGVHTGYSILYAGQMQ